MNTHPLSTLRRVRWAVRATLSFGVAASVAANILHAQHNPISQTIAAWPPLALLLTVELVSRVPVHRWALAAIRVLATMAISGIAAWVSYWHMVGVASHYGETDASPYLLPVSVDGLIVVASICLVELAGRIRVVETPAVTGQSTVPYLTSRSDEDSSDMVAGNDAATAESEPVLDADLVERAHQAAVTYRRDTGRDITRDQLRAALRVSNVTASVLLRLVRDSTPTPTAPDRADGATHLRGELTR